MKKIECRGSFAQLASAVLFALAAVAASAQTAGLQYKVMGGQVYAYEPSNPAAVYLIPNMTPEQVGLGGEANAQAQAQAQAAAEQAQMNTGQNGSMGNLPRIFPYNTNMAPIPARPAASNSALPVVTFREPVFSPQNLPRPNPIGGLPRYPGKNYSPGNLASPW